MSKQAVNIDRLSPRLPGAPWSISDAALFLSTSTRTITRLIAARRVRSIRISRRRLIPDDEVQRLAQEGI